jgi:hypothetical protein
VRNASRRDIVHGGCFNLFNLFNHFLFVRFIMMNLVDRLNEVVTMQIEGMEIEVSITIDVSRGEQSTYDYPGSDDMFELVEIQALTLTEVVEGSLSSDTLFRDKFPSLFSQLDDVVQQVFYDDEDVYIERVIGL